MPFVVCLFPIANAHGLEFRVKLKLDVAVAYRPLVLTMSLIYIVLNADRGRHADALVSYLFNRGLGRSSADLTIAVVQLTCYRRN